MLALETLKGKEEKIIIFVTRPFTEDDKLREEALRRIFIDYFDVSKLRGIIWDEEPNEQPVASTVTHNSTPGTNLLKRHIDYVAEHQPTRYLKLLEQRVHSVIDHGKFLYCLQSRMYKWFGLFRRDIDTALAECFQNDTDTGAYLNLPGEAFYRSQLKGVDLFGIPRVDMAQLKKLADGYSNEVSSMKLDAGRGGERISSTT
eukprot:gb/GECG01006086.1/.p1 GENE.gb/GECG01006086.1/~~gb/GECG01006086.1/.p1  ORF type:complete len:202 (+),score=32.58 gb/GECG01006086.1/:1-606(+)